MKLLLDTHTFIWFTLAPTKLSQRLRNAIADPANDLALSVVSIWEMQIKYQLGKLSLPVPVPDLVKMQRGVNDFLTLTVLEDHVWALDQLPLHHRDPFDRLLIAQAMVEGYQLATLDSVFQHYPVDLFPA